MECNSIDKDDDEDEEVQVEAEETGFSQVVTAVCNAHTVSLWKDCHRT
jgi:hypothetical protein